MARFKRYFYVTAAAIVLSLPLIEPSFVAKKSKKGTENNGSAICESGLTGAKIVVIEGSDEREETPGDFAINIRVASDAPKQAVLVVPSRIRAILDTVGANDPLEFISYLQIAPSFFAQELNWSAKQVVAAKKALISQIAPYLDPEVVKALKTNPVKRKYLPVPKSLKTDSDSTE